ncbi:hypothetical protein NVP1021C_32 [Vibrio phage 1.021.C._10N.222.51.F9]|nr:hypothetical protein NVP1021A_32 [Vibrio phage 1.021.A._10N.222.51.F9]AUR82145.1 hypothetical protein NVP1021B_32 [Vibrio phage 1.021.B._10N.222.51.F9]AUR82195.1 hypothetical protein NVP1021C_32 [Vibrio phage 1.021.C._10N.222.51.F9]
MMAKIKHGLRYTPEYSLWLNMKSRCYNPKNHTYKYYGGRGITVCDQWVDDFKQFYDDMCPRPGDDYQIDRRDNDKGYSPENCQWVKRINNVRNRKDSKWWYVHGVKYESLGHASECLGVGINTIKRWCEGRSDGGYVYPPKHNCWSENKYK